MISRSASRAGVSKRHRHRPRQVQERRLRARRATRRQQFHTFDTTPAALHELLSSAQTRARPDGQPTTLLLAIETCDASGWVHVLAVALGIAVRIAHTAGQDAWRWKKVKRKHRPGRCAEAGEDGPGRCVAGGGARARAGQASEASAHPRRPAARERIFY
jgi:hypothetical protein